MPERNFEGLMYDEYRLQQAVSYVPGYDWLPGRFGPPPGITKPFKDQLDRMQDRDYLFAFMKLGQEEKESLMISEAERRRTFTSHWPIWNIVDGYACAKEGFYYTGIIRNWERGDNPKESHRKYFSYCKMAQRKPCHNIPYDQSDIPAEIMTEQLSTSSRHASSRLKMCDLGIIDSRPSHSKYSISQHRISSYKTYNVSKYPISPADLSAAGFFYEGPADKVRCFWCSGALELWTKGDDPWWEHARWYPGCVFVRQNKGVKYVISARSSMSDDEIETASSLIYNSADISFLSNSSCKVDIKSLDSYSICKSLGYSEDLLVKAFEMNSGDDFQDIQDLLTILNSLESSDMSDAHEIVSSLQTQQYQSQKKSLKAEKHKLSNVTDILKKSEELTETESDVIVSSMTCHHCDEDQVGAVVLPCGHFCLCHNCSRKDLPSKCPLCYGVVKGACRAFLC